MSNSIKLTKRAIDSLTYCGGWDVRWDSEVTGFGVRLYPSGKKSYILSYRIDGRKKLIVLGSANTITVDEARNMAKVNLAALISKNEDPAEAKKHNKKGDSFGDFCKIYMERHAKKHKKTWQEDQRKLNRHILPLWRNMKIHSITKSDVVNLHSKIGTHTPYEANRTIRLISSLFELAKNWGYLDETYTNPTKYIKLFK